MRIEDDGETRSLFLKAVARSEQRSGIHVTDLQYCLRESYFKTVNPKPASEVELGYFVDGAARHLILQSLHPGKAEAPTHLWGISGTIDILKDDPIEIKTTRSRMDGVNPFFIKQLVHYCILLRRSTGRLVIQRLNLRNEPFLFKKLTFAPDELDYERLEMLGSRDLLMKALRMRNPSVLPRFSDPYDQREPQWKCRSCKYRVECEFTI